MKFILIGVILFNISNAFFFSSNPPSLTMTFEGASSQCVYLALRKIVNPSSIRIRVHNDEGKDQRYVYLSFRDEVLAAAFPEYFKSDIRIEAEKVIKVTISASYKRGTDLDKSTFKDQAEDQAQAIKSESLKLCTEKH